MRQEIENLDFRSETEKEIEMIMNNCEEYDFELNFSELKKLKNEKKNEIKIKIDGFEGNKLRILLNNDKQSEILLLYDRICNIENSHEFERIKKIILAKLQEKKMKISKLNDQERNKKILKLQQYLNFLPFEIKNKFVAANQDGT